MKRPKLHARLSQSQLARQADVDVHNNQPYEQRRNDIDKAQALTLYRLVHVHDCQMESPIKNPMV